VGRRAVQTQELAEEGGGGDREVGSGQVTLRRALLPLRVSRGAVRIIKRVHFRFTRLSVDFLGHCHCVGNHLVGLVRNITARQEPEKRCGDNLRLRSLYPSVVSIIGQVG
jgi:hypothetical protein